MASRLLSEVRFGSYLVYSPSGTSDVSIRSRRVRNAVKGVTEPTFSNVVAHLARNFPATGLSAVLGPDVTLVPCPRSSPLVEGALWPGRRIAEELAKRGLGKQVIASVERIEAVPKSAFQARGERPNAQRHYDTMQAAADFAATERITLVDDFVTKGNTLLGAASRLAEAYPRATISVFALVRTKGLQREIDALVEPVVGRIWERFPGEADREP